MREVSIPGGTATLREREDLSERNRRLVKTRGLAASAVITRLQKAVEDANGQEPDPESLQISASEAEVTLDVQDAVIVALLASWTLDRPLPTMDTVQDLPGDLYDALAKETADLGAEVATETDFGENPDPKATGGESGTSDGS